MGRAKSPFPLKQRPGSKCWYVAYYTPDGRRKYKSTGTSNRDEAILRVAQWRTESTIATGTRPMGLSEAAIKARAVFNDVTQDFFGPSCPYQRLRNVGNAKRAASTISLQNSCLRNWIRPFFGAKIVSVLKAKEFEEFIEFLKEKGNSAAQIHNILSATKVILSTLFKIERVPVDKSPLVPSYARSPKNRKEFLDLGEFQRLLSASYLQALRNPETMPLWIMFSICYLCGMRVGEIQALRWKNFIYQLEESKRTNKACFLVEADWQEESGTIKESTKTYGRRYVPIPEIVFHALNTKIADKYLNSEICNDVAEQLIFPSTRNPSKPFYRSTLNSYMKRECKRLDILKKISPHRGRDWFQSQLTGRVDKGLVSYAVGHSQGAVDDTYLIAVFGQLEPIRVAINSLVNEAVRTVEKPAF